MSQFPRKGLLPLVEKPAGAPNRPLAAHPAKGQFLGVDWSKHPGLGEGIVPVWGPVRDTVADLHDHNYAMAAIDAASTIGDLDPAVSLGRAVAREVGEQMVRRSFRNGLQKGLSWTWNAAGKRMRRPDKSGEILLRPGQEGHHWLIPQGGWGKVVPDVIKNRRFNIKPLEQETHRRIHSRFNGQPRFNPIERYWHGTPARVKRGAAGLAGQAAVSGVGTAASARHEGR